jgi:hypothetical protein
MVLFPGIDDPGGVRHFSGKEIRFQAGAGFVMESSGGDALGLASFN